MSARAKIRRDDAGVPHIDGATPADLAWGLGYVHATDRGLQMLLMRILGQGRAAELLDPGEQTVAVDRFFRRMNWGGASAEEVSKLPPDSLAIVEAYCAGASARLAERSPWELRWLLGCGRPGPWTPADCVLIARMTGYLTLAQSQAEVERLFVEMVQAGVAREKLEELFPGNLGGLDEALLRKVALGERLVPPAVRWGSGAAAAAVRAMASNNWVIAGSKTASGKPILANDPHLEANRLPNVWCEVVLKSGGRYGVGVTMPGMPALLVGRTNDLAWGATYAFMDAIDSWVEECRDGKYRREDAPGGWAPFRARKETIRRKKGAPIEVTFHENDHGVLDGDPAREGFYLATRWSSARSGAASLEAMTRMWTAASVEEGMALLGRIELAFSWVLADRGGRIGFQMSGLLPRRREGVSGFVPLPGWDPRNDWQGFHDPGDLPRALDPEAGFFVTANQDLNAHGRAKPINMPMGAYRAERIAEVLSASAPIGVREVQALQYDVLSLQARRFLEVLRPLLPGTEQGKILREWDLRYELDSRGAFLFEELYRALLEHVFGEGGFGPDAVSYLGRETGTFADFYASFDRVLLSERSAWFGGRSRDEVFRQVAERALKDVAPRPWGERQRVPLSNILLGGKLPRWLGFDRGPLPVRGGRATVQQGQIYRSGKRLTTFVPSLRFVTDLASDEAHSVIVGGPSDRRFSRFYDSDTASWLEGRYKVLKP